MELERYWSSIRKIMGYYDADVRVYIDVVGPLYLSGPVLYTIHLYLV